MAKGDCGLNIGIGKFFEYKRYLITDKEGHIDHKNINRVRVEDLEFYGTREAISILKKEPGTRAFLVRVDYTVEEELIPK